MVLVYVVTETHEAESFDPLNADQTLNLHTMRMLYSTPLYINALGELDSQILSSFSYDQSTNTITFIVGEDHIFSNGLKISAEDVALAISRVAFFKPEFPVVKNILGIREWISSSNIHTFPKGIKVSGQEVKIFLEKDNSNALFRFCLELFSII
ncbi:MAG: hypothetical protein ACK5WZ_02885, partial [Pseudobdellovibrionaceae bacterium]